jgi:hypothetical protein
MVHEKATVTRHFFWRFVRYVGMPRNLIGASIVRICLGVVVLALYVQNVGSRALFWGPNGQIPFSTHLEELRAANTFSLYAFNASDAWFNFIFILSAIVTLLFAIGLFTRVTAPLFVVCTWSLFFRNQWILNGGSDAVFLSAVYLMFADLGAYFSIDALRRRRTLERKPSIVGASHNYAVLAVIIQLSVLYFFSTFYKIEGHKWQDGTALYYILRSHDFDVSPLNALIYHNAALVTIGTYSVLALQSAFVWLIWDKRVKPWIALIVIVFHVGIAMTMGLFWFSFTMIALDLLLFSDAQYCSLGGLLVAGVRRILPAHDDGAVPTHPTGKVNVT